MRRSLALLTFAAALVATTSAIAALQPVRRDFGELRLPRVRAGTVRIPPGHGSGLVRVIVDLKLPPLAAAYGRDLAGRGHTRRLNVASASSRAYLARIDTAQRKAAAELRRAIPEATISRRFRVLLDGLTVSLPVTRLPTLARLGFVDRIYPSLRYTIDLNQSPSVIGADAIAQATGARGDGIKIAVVDTGVDRRSPFLSPQGFSYPEGFPKGGRAWVSEKVIVARVFPGPGSGRQGRLAVNLGSPHGTHVAGIAAGDAGTNAPAGPDHPAVAGLSGVAPRAWIGNYRVFTIPTAIGPQANTPEIVAAFESAVEDGMDVINFSGGGPQTDPLNDAMVETVTNVVNAGVVPVVAAGNDRDDFGLGSVGSPGIAPDAIAVAAVSNMHVFSPTLTVVAAGAPAAVEQVPFTGAGGELAPPAWGTLDQTLVDVGTIVGTDGKSVDRRLCGSPADPNGPANPLPPHSLDGVIALVSRGTCSFFSKLQRARDAGAVGIIYVDNRPGEANFVPIRTPLPGGMISDLDGSRLRDYMASSGGRTTIRVGRDFRQIETGRSGVLTSFSSAGPTDFGHVLKPDVAAPGGQILSSVTPESVGSLFEVFDGTSMSTPHVAGAAALLLQVHPSWSPRQVKSALVSTAGPAWVDTARTTEAPVTLEGGGLVNLPRATDPMIFTEPVSLSFGDLNVNRSGTTRPLLITLTDAGDGSGNWQVELQPQAATAGAGLDVQWSIAIPPGGAAELPFVARAAVDAPVGDDYGFVVLRRGENTRRIPYFFSVTRPALESVQATPLQSFQTGDTLIGVSHASAYRYPAAPFGPAPDYVGQPVHEDGVERLYVTRLNDAAVNMGVAVWASSAGSLIDPWFLGSQDENDVQGYAGIPVDVNALTFDYRFDVGAAGVVFPRQKRYFVSVDSGRDPFTGRTLAGRYLLHAWVNDVFAPVLELMTVRVSAGRPLIAVRAIDPLFGSGVDPLSLAIGYKQVLVGAAFYDQLQGIALFPLPKGAPALKAGNTRAILVASDFQEAKNIAVAGANIMPNTGFQRALITVVDGPALTWLAPDSESCAGKPARLLVTATSTKPVRSVRFYDGSRLIKTDRKGAASLFTAVWSTKGLERGEHGLRAVATDKSGASASATRIVRVCR